MNMMSACVGSRITQECDCHAIVEADMIHVQEGQLLHIHMHA